MPNSLSVTTSKSPTADILNPIAIDCCEYDVDL